MRNLIPHFIHTQYQAGRVKGQFRALSLFVDISGFTQLTETLMQYDKDGAEILTSIINRLFNPLIDMVYRSGGFVASFGGDALTALFPLQRKDAALYTVQTAFATMDLFSRQSAAHTKYGDFALSAKIGLGIGSVHWRILGASDGHTYFFRGQAIDSCVQAEHQASTGEIVSAADLLPLIDGYVQVEPRHQHFRLLKHTFQGSKRQPALPALTRETLTAFGLEPLIDLTVSAEFRDVATVFISVDEPDQPRLEAFVSQTLTAARNYGGYFNKLDFGDKGCIMLVLFGAPAAHENDLVRAADFLLALKEQTSTTQWRAGLTFGTVYAGFLGGAERTEYTAIGDMVNLAARLTMSARWGEVWVSPSVAVGLHAKGYEFQLLGMFTFKGKREAVTVVRLERKHTTLPATTAYRATLIGRAAELQQIEQRLQSLAQNGFGGLIYIYGEPGIGKSRFVHELQQQVTRDQRLLWVTCPADETLRQSLNPFKHFLRSYFNQLDKQPTEQNRRRFNEVLDTLINALPLPASLEIQRELQRTRSFLAALLDLHQDGSLYAQLEPKLRFENTLIAFRTLIIAESLRQPVVVYIEDAHWLDADSRALIQTLTRNVAQYAFAVLLTSRYDDDGKLPMVSVDSNVPHVALDLKPFSAAELQTLAVELLGGQIAEPLVTFLVGKTNGNPFFAEQLLLDLQERHMLSRGADGVWQLRRQSITDVPTSINVVLIARLDRLTAQVKRVVQTAAVLGQEFEIQILSNMLNNDVDLPTKVQQAEAGAIWWTLNEIRYLFRHTLLRDAAYDMQLRAHLRELHTLAGQAIETVYADDLNAHAADLAYHYGRAEDVVRERSYSQAAGEQAMTRFANTEALTYLSRALALTPAADVMTQAELLLAREKVYDLQGARQSQAQELDALEKLADRLTDATRAEIALRRANYAEVTSDYPASIEASKQAIALSQAAAVKDVEAKGHLSWGQVLVWQANYSAAQEQLERALSLARAAGLTGLEGRSLLTLGSAADYQGNFSAARTNLEQALQLFREAGDRRREAIALQNLSGVMLNEGNFGAARTNLEQALQLFRLIGDRRGESIAFFNLGGVAGNQGDFATSSDYSQQALRLFRDIGEKRGESFALENLGDMARCLGTYAAAQTYLEQAVQLCQEIGNRYTQGQAWLHLSLVHHHQGDHITAHSDSTTALRIAEEDGAKQEQGRALTVLGHVLAGLQRWDEAVTAYQQASTLYQELGASHFALEPLAGLAHVSFMQHNLTQAHTHVETLLPQLQANALDGTDEPFRVYLTCYRVLNASHDARTPALLTQMHTRLQDQAVKIPAGALRQSFLQNTPIHREIVAAWADSAENK